MSRHLLALGKLEGSCLCACTLGMPCWVWSMQKKCALRLPGALQLSVEGSFLTETSSTQDQPDSDSEAVLDTLRCKAAIARWPGHNCTRAIRICLQSTHNVHAILAGSTAHCATMQFHTMHIACCNCKQDVAFACESKRTNSKAPPGS